MRKRARPANVRDRMSLKSQTQAVVLATATTVIPPRVSPLELRPPEVVRVAPAKRVPLDLDAEVFYYERLADGTILPGQALDVAPHCARRHPRPWR